MEINSVNNIPPDLVNEENNIKIDSEIAYTDATESQKYSSINQIPSSKDSKLDINKLNNDSPKSKKKKKVNFVDQIYAKKDIAEIIYINDKVSLKDDKIDSNKIKYEKHNINKIDSKENSNNIEMYKIKRPKKKSLFYKKKNKIDKVDEKCSCKIF